MLVLRIVIHRYGMSVLVSWRPLELSRVKEIDAVTFNRRFSWARNGYSDP
jgi:hypothetical protein